MSVGSRSGVHCTRPKRPPSAAARLLASRVLPVPGQVLDQQVAAGEQRHQRQAHHVVLAPHRARHGVEQRRASSSMAAWASVAAGPSGWVLVTWAMEPKPCTDAGAREGRSRPAAS